MFVLLKSHVVSRFLLVKTHQDPTIDIGFPSQVALHAPSGATSQGLGNVFQNRWPTIFHVFH